jgi:hypothetical protein
MPSSPIDNEENKPEKVKLKYKDGNEYDQIYSSLLDLEESYIKAQLEKYTKKIEKVFWKGGESQQDRKFATFSWPEFINENLRLMNIGDNVRFSI